jgi:hypothetical protein
MPAAVRLGIVSDIHYASAAEQARGGSYEYAGIRNPALRLFVRWYRQFFWLRDPLQKNYLLDRFLTEAEGLDHLVANGDYACNTASVGLSDDAVYQSVRECLGKLRQAFAGRLSINYGDHELGKLSFFGGRGGMRLASWHRARRELELEPFWQRSFGNYRLMGVVSSLLALPIFEPDTLPAERGEWERLRAEHLEQIRQAFAEVPPAARILLFCHDPTALPFLLREPAVGEKLAQVEQTVIGHLHSNLILWKSRWLSGMPRVRFLGHTALRLSSALREARAWRPFRVRLCPSLAGIELLKDGGYLTVELDPDGRRPARFQLQRLKR